MTAEDKSDRDLLLAMHSDMVVTKEIVKRVEVQVTSQNGRIGALEKWRWIVVGAFTAMLAVMPFLIYDIRQAIAEMLAGGAMP